MEPDDRDLPNRGRDWLGETRDAPRAEAAHTGRQGIPGSKRLEPGDYATGVEMHARLARHGKPLPITVGGLPQRLQPRMSIRKSLEAKPESENG